MAFDEALLEKKYELCRLNVVSGTQISSRTTTVVSKLGQEKNANEKPVLVVLAAKSRCANKLISVVEIAKRELVSRGIKCCQYNALTSELVDIPRERRQILHPSSANDEVKDESDDAFETMGAPTGSTKKRNMPSMTVYLATNSVKELKAAYG